MSDRVNRVLWSLVALVLAIGGGGGLAFSLGALGSSSAHADVITSTLARQWHRGGNYSFAVASAIGLVLVIAGLGLAAAELSRDAGRSRLEDFTVGEPTPPVPASRGGKASVGGGAGSSHRPGAKAPGFTLVSASSLASAVEADLTRIAGVQDATVRLIGKPNDVELRARLDLEDDADLSSLEALAQACMKRLATTSGVHPSPIDLTLTLAPPKHPRVS